MTRTITLLMATATLLVAGVALAAVEPLSEGTLLEFQVREDLRLDSLDGATIAWRRVAGTDRAWRIGLSPSFSRAESGEIKGPYDRREEREGYGLEVEVVRLRYRPLQNRTRGYWGFGPVVGGSYVESRAVQSDSTVTALRTSKDIRRNWYVGGGLVVGAEVVFSPDLSLSAEYGALVTLTSRSTSPSGSTAREFAFRSRGARLGLALRF